VSSTNEFRPREGFAWLGLALAVIVALLALIMGGSWAFGAFGRTQAIAAANNQAHVRIINADNAVQTTNIQINTEAQQLKVHQEDAAIRQADAVGIREAQNEISGTLTPLYVQWEATQAIEQIAESGKNSSVIYVPSGAGGVPLIADTSGKPSVTAP